MIIMSVRMSNLGLSTVEIWAIARYSCYIQVACQIDLFGQMCASRDRDDFISSRLSHTCRL